MDKFQLIKDFFEKDEEYPAKVLRVKEIGRDCYEVETEDETGKHKTELGFVNGTDIMVLPQG
jgi:hypothetical protein